jgi:membrane fusion protein, multidrug efflux system
MKKIISIVVVVIIIILAIFKLKSNFEKINSQKAVLGENDAIPVNVTTVKKMSADQKISLVGTLNTDQELNIASEIQGKITQVDFMVGQQKEKGSVLAVIDDKLKQLAVQSAKISYDKLKKDLERSENLYKGGTVSEQQLEEARNSFENARIQLEQAEKQLSYTKIVAPISGVITQKLVEEGTYVNIGSSIAYIVNVSKLKVKLNVSESNVYQLKSGDKATVTTNVYPGITFNGKVSFISPKGDEYHNYPVEIEISNDSKHLLRAGTFVDVLIEFDSKGEILYIPRGALLGSSKDATVYVAENGVAKLKKIIVSGENDKYLEVLSGLNEGEKVVVTGQINLSENKSIKIINNN